MDGLVLQSQGYPGGPGRSTPASQGLTVEGIGTGIGEVGLRTDAY